ncbi:MAG: methyl viologen-reducing hydrogenase [Myxococcota bacterium]
MASVKVSFEWLSGCSGCELSIVDMHEKLLRVLELIEIVRLPILVDTKDYPKAQVGIITGALRTEHDVECAHKMRESCDAILAFGTCAVYGGPQGSGYAHTLRELEDSSFRRNPTTTTDFVPDKGVPRMLEEGVRPLDSEINVDLYLPGCAPHPYFVFESLTAVIEGRAPEFGPENVCYRCTRKMGKSDASCVRRIHDGSIDPETCFLSQGILCMGSVSLDRCLAPCPDRGLPCSGCAGPSEHLILEPYRDIRTEIAERMSRMTKIPYDDVVREIEQQSKTFYAYAMASPVFRQKPTFLLRRWTRQEGASR